MDTMSSDKIKSAKFTFYLVFMRRIIGNSQHAYPIGIYGDFDKARKAMEIEEVNRAGKYRGEIEQFILDELPEDLAK